jgi:Na+/alanine symporter
LFKLWFINKIAEKMKMNIGSFDKTLRIVLALVLLVVALSGIITVTKVLQIVLVVLAAIFLITALVGVCPLYLPFGIKTNRK